jgi:putative ABC transport system permease protein
VPADQVKPADEARWVLNGDRGLTYSATLPEGSKLVEGEWWREDYAGPPLVSFEDEIAEGLGLKVGDTVVVNVLGRNVEARLASTRSVDWESLSINFVMVFSPNALAGAPFNLLATVALPEDLPVDREGRMVRRLAETFPTVTAIRVRDALQLFETLVEKVMVAIRAAAGFTLLTGAVVLAGALATSQRRRVREAVIFKTLGATRRRIVGAHLIEYALLAAVTGVSALGLGTLGAYLTLRFAMQSDFTFSAPAVLQALGFAILLVLVFGAIGTWRALSARPAQQLRAQ